MVDLKVGGKVVRKLKTSEKRLVLTFDDGPDEPATREILEILAQYKIKAVFFLLGKSVERFPSLAKEIAAQGHQIGNHGYEHRGGYFTSIRLVRDGISRTDSIIEKLGLKPPRIYRPPYRRIPVPLLLRPNSINKTIILADVSVKDFRLTSADLIRARVLKKVSPGSIILLHDGGGDRKYTVEALPGILEDCLEKGYEFITIC